MPLPSVSSTEVQNPAYAAVQTQPSDTTTRTVVPVAARNTDACCGCGQKADSRGGCLSAVAWLICCFPCGAACCAITAYRARAANS